MYVFNVLYVIIVDELTKQITNNYGLAINKLNSQQGKILMSCWLIWPLLHYFYLFIYVLLLHIIALLMDTHSDGYNFLGSAFSCDQWIKEINMISLKIHGFASVVCNAIYLIFGEGLVRAKKTYMSIKRNEASGFFSWISYL